MINQGRSYLSRYFDPYPSRTQRSSYYAIKGLFLLLLMVGFFLYKFTYYMDFTHICIHDAVQDFLYPVNRWTDRDPLVTVILIGQLLIDGLTCTLAAYWLYCHHNIYLPNLILIFYLIRTPILKLIKFPFPDDFVWKATPVPSIMVPYDRTSDFFFSGHTGLAILLTVQFTRMKFPKWTLWICYFSIAYMPFMLVSTRAHYIVDILASPFYTHLAWHIHELFKKELDYLWSIPYVIWERIYSRYFKEEETDNKLIDDNLS